MNKSIPEILTETGREFTGRGMSFRMTASGTSMLPSLRPGDQLLVAPCKKEEKSLLGKVIVVQLPNKMYAHRVVKECFTGKEIQYLTRGDCLRENDEVISRGQVLGVVTHYVRSGRKQQCRAAGNINRRFLLLRAFLYFYYRRLRHAAARLLKNTAA